MSTKKDNLSLNMNLRTDIELSRIDHLEKILEKSSLSHVEHIGSFPLYASRQDIASFLVKYELFKKIKNIHGSIIECGVANGSGLMSFAHFSSIFEPVNYTRKIIGFDTFEGFPSLSSKDKEGKDPRAKVGGMRFDSYDELIACRELYDNNRFVSHINKIELVKGDINETAPKYIKNNEHLVVALLYLDFDLYEPTIVALKHFLPRMPKGSIIAFDEINHPDWPGETLAILEKIGINNLKIKRFSFDSVRSYAIIE